MKYAAVLAVPVILALAVEIWAGVGCLFIICVGIMLVRKIREIERAEKAEIDHE
jgi:hypothetical protein